MPKNLNILKFSQDVFVCFKRISTFVSFKCELVPRIRIILFFQCKNNVKLTLRVVHLNFKGEGGWVISFEK